MKFYALFLLLFPTLCGAVEYKCDVDRKLDSERVYSADQLKKGQFSVLIKENGSTASLSRCSFSSSAQAVTCDQYDVDKIAFDENVKIKKYYVFRSHFDVHVFSDLSFLENNGRGTIAFGKCAVVAP